MREIRVAVPRFVSDTTGARPGPRVSPPMPDPDRLLRTLYKAADATRLTPGRKGRFVQLQGASEVLVGGDLHGHLGNFQAIYQAADLAKNPKRHLVLQEVVHGKFFYPGGMRWTG